VAAPSVYTNLLYASPSLTGLERRQVGDSESWVVRFCSVGGGGGLSEEGAWVFYGASNARWWQGDLEEHSQHYAQWEGRVVIPPGDFLSFETGQPMSIYCCGYVFAV
jgi:hypothetical protein